MKIFEIEGQLSLFDESLFSIKAVAQPTKRNIKFFEAWTLGNGNVYIAIDESNTLIAKTFEGKEEHKCSNSDVATALFNDIKDKIVMAACLKAVQGKGVLKRIDFLPASA